MFSVEISGLPNKQKQQKNPRRVASELQNARTIFTNHFNGPDRAIGPAYVNV